MKGGLARQPAVAAPGRLVGRPAPFGHRWEGRELVPDEREAPVLELLLDLFLQHRRKKTVARLLNEMGHRTRGGTKWSDTAVGRLLRDPVATELVSDKTRERVNAILDEGERQSRRAVHLFAGLAFCRCGAKMYVPSNSPKYVCPKCRTKIPADDLEAVFRAQLKGIALSPAEAELSDVQDLATRWSDLDRTEKREVVENIAERIVVGSDEVEIELYALPLSPETVVTGQRGVEKPEGRSRPTRQQGPSRRRGPGNTGEGDGRPADTHDENGHQGTAATSPRIVRSAEVCSRTGLSRTTIWRLVKKGELPAPRRLSTNTIGWLEGEIDAWIKARETRR